MVAVARLFSNQFRTHWVGVKFYKQKPDARDINRPKGVRFCEVTKRAILGPVLLDKESITCPGAHFAFGWNSGSQKEEELLDCCQDKRQTQKSMLESMLSYTPCLKEPPQFIGLNTTDDPDLMMSYLSPEDAMNIIKTYHNKRGRNLDVSLCSMMSICGGIAVRAFKENRISFSFGCDDSRKYADIGRDRLVIGIPKSMFEIFVPTEPVYAKAR